MNKSPDGVSIAYYEAGPKDGDPILLIHGFSQAAMCWQRQMESKLSEKFRLISLDMRGHGASDKPADPDAYNQSKPYADDIEALLDHLDIESAVLVGWSMGGNWICDYLRHHGEKRVRGIFLAGATTQQGTEVSEKMFGDAVGDSLGGMFEADPTINVASTKAFVRACTASPLPADEFEDMLGFNMLVPPAVRLAMLDRVTANEDVVSTITVPVTQVHGAEDGIVLPFAGEFTMSGIGHDKKSLILYEDTGHCTFWEQADRFNSDLAGFVSGL